MTVGLEILSGRYQFVTVGYESCEKSFKKLGFRNQRLTGLLYHFNNFLMNFIGLSYHSHRTTIRKLPDFQYESPAEFQYESPFKIFPKALSNFQYENPVKKS